MALHLMFVTVGAYLLFMLQPLVGRLLLPAYGGGFHVWTTCVMFFQGVLLLGYAYAHGILSRVGRWHCALLVGSLAWLPIVLPATMDPQTGIASMTGLLLRRIALPALLLSTTGVAAQLALARATDPASTNPYRLYAASNLGSLLGLLTYPFLLEPLLGLAAQRWLFSAGYAVYCALAVTLFLQQKPLPRAQTAVPATSVSVWQVLYWFGLSACGVVLLLGVTNLIAFGAGSMPLVWVLALAVYLGSFIAAFRPVSANWLGLRRYALEAACVGMLCFVEPERLPEGVYHALLLGSLFFLCWIAHTELYATRPDVGQLTRFYLALAAGGFAGGSFVNLLAPLLFTDLDEYPLGLALLLALLVLGRRRELGAWLHARASWAEPRRFRYGRWLRSLALGGVGAALLTLYLAPYSGAALRNQYGIFRVWDRTRGSGAERRTLRILGHNQTNHGVQSLRPDERRLPTGYFHRNSPLGELLSRLPRPVRFGAVGLGAGTVATYFQAGDELVFYELDADSERLARKHFTFLRDCNAELRVLIGDARISLQRELGAARYGGLLVDAFSGDAIPFHLLTREALALYLSRVEPGAPIIFHISSRFYELWPGLAATARSVGAMAAHKTRSRRERNDLDALEWSNEYAVVSTDAAMMKRLETQGWIASSPLESAWTDDHVNVLKPLWLRLTASR